MPELREDVTTGDWVALSAERARRPHEFHREGAVVPALPPGATCPFCPGSEADNPDEVERLHVPGSGATWDVRIVANRYPALRAEVRPARNLVDGHFAALTGLGRHEVVIESPRHDCELPDMSEAELALQFEAYQRRFRALGQDGNVAAVFIIKNHGELAGASIAHPHAQVIASPIVPPLSAKRRDVARRYYREQGGNLYAELCRWELQAGRRVVFEERDLVAFQPYASRWPYETWVVPLRGQAAFSSATPAERADVARAVRRTLRLLRQALGAFPYNLVVLSALPEEEGRVPFLWHVQIIPRLIIPGGAEVGAGLWVNNAFPEETAAYLRQLDSG